jgi:hypothetical protein
LAGLRPEEGRLHTPNVAVLVGEDGAVDVAEAHQLIGQNASLVTAKLEQESAPGPEEARSVAEDAPEDVGAVDAAIV